MVLALQGARNQGSEAASRAAAGCRQSEVAFRRLARNRQQGWVRHCRGLTWCKRLLSNATHRRAQPHRFFCCRKCGALQLQANRGIVLQRQLRCQHSHRTSEGRQCDVRARRRRPVQGCHHHSGVLQHSSCLWLRSIMECGTQSRRRGERLPRAESVCRWQRAPS